MVPSRYTSELIKLTLDIAKTALENDKKYFIGSGLAIDLSLGEITRDHHDIDFHPMIEDSQWWRDWFANRGYEVKMRVKTDFPEVYKVKDSAGEEVVDFWPFHLKDGKLLINFNGELVDSNKRWDETKRAEFDGVSVVIENPMRVLEQKENEIKKGKKLRPQDQHDFELFGREVLL